jgi:hypothetical protein
VGKREMRRIQGLGGRQEGGLRARQGNEGRERRREMREREREREEDEDRAKTNKGVSFIQSP